MLIPETFTFLSTIFQEKTWLWCLSKICASIRSYSTEISMSRHYYHFLQNGCFLWEVFPQKYKQIKVLLTIVWFVWIFPCVYPYNYKYNYNYKWIVLWTRSWSLSLQSMCLYPCQPTQLLPALTLIHHTSNILHLLSENKFYLTSFIRKLIASHC